MENQHRKITGYRELSQEEIDLMNEIKSHAEATKALLDKVNRHIEVLLTNCTGEEAVRINAAQPARWHAMARTELQTAFMKLTRAVAQPTSF